jgi:hypothetical protein
VDDGKGVYDRDAFRSPSAKTTSADLGAWSKFHKGTAKASFHEPFRVMENFPLVAQHSGAINHLHSFHFNSSVVDVLKEIRLGVTIVVAGWVTVVTIRTLRDSFMREPGRGN